MGRRESASAGKTRSSRRRRASVAKPGDYLVALSVATASVPVIGRHLELLGGFAALGVGGRHYLPGILTGIAQPRLSPSAGNAVVSNVR